MLPKSGHIFAICRLSVNAFTIALILQDTKMIEGEKYNA